jgi:Zn-dependent peptidase ImmA (M78 family)
MTTMKALIAEANRLGLTVHVAHLEEDLLGYYDHEASQIVLRIDLTMAQMKATLAHEIGHAYHCHPCSSESHERVANRAAARLLVDPILYAAAESLNPDPWAIADELGVTIGVIENYQRYWLQSRAGQTFAS